MQCILREKLLAQAIKLAGVSNSYRNESHRFVEAYFEWLEEAEKDLSGLRSPIGILLQAEKSTLTSVLDGYLPNHIEPGKSIRKSQKAVAAQSLEKLSKEIYSKIEQIDHTLDQLSEKLCHAVAVLASKEPDLYSRLQVNQHGVNILWEMLGRTPETIPMYNYFCAKLASTDLNYLFMDIIQKITSNKSGAI
ncbi:MAG: hypothetical protein A2X79_02670 [Desulfuromonadaceae bacterium GWB2_53_15]|nr:MAG: hypothetical protein A2X83_04080 [Desulfuromonadales bacterium GWD2_54_10]OHB31713.1 MAG: hypothetical protein A2X79_02670 [Desulfuromonadaceae bacterium GWB2_53_15]